MKKLVAFIILFPLITSGQKISVHFKSAFTNAPIPFVSLYIDGKVKAADIHGEIVFEGGGLAFSTSHVSFTDTLIAIQQIKNDTTIIVHLSEKIESLDDLTVQTAEKYFTKNYSTSGSTDLKSNYIISLHSNLKVGIFYKPDNDKSIGRYLRSLRLKMQNAKALKTQDFPIELKIYGVHDGLIDSVPLNRKQIILLSGALKSVSEIFVQQRIKIPVDGLFLSLELPPVFPDADTNANLYAVFDKDNCQLFVAGGLRPNWDPTLLRKSCTRDENGKAKNIIYSITYFDPK